MYSIETRIPDNQSTIDPKSEQVLKEKINFLQREFAEIDVNHDSTISKEELFGYLDLKAKKEFNRAIANEIWEQMDKNHDNMVTLQEFIKVYIEADEILNKKIEMSKSNKEHYQKQQEECLRKAEEAKHTERLNAYGIMEDSFIDVSLLEAKGLRAPNIGGPIDIYIEITLNDQQLKRTKITKNVPEPKFDEKFTFDVADSNSQLRFTIYDAARFNKQQFEGEVIVLLEELKDQNIYDVWLDIYDKNGNKAKGQIHAKLQWIHSRVIYHTLYAQKWFDYYKKEDEELQEYERYLSQLHEPFTGMKAAKYAMSTLATIPSSRLEPPGWMNIDDHVIGITNKMISYIEPNPNESFWQKSGIIIALAGMILGIFICFARGDFIDVIVPLMAFFYLINGTFKEITSLKALAWVLFITLVVLDLPWLWIYTRKWASYDITDSGLQGSIKVFTIFITYINFFFKIIEGLIYYMIHIHLSKERNNYYH